MLFLNFHIEFSLQLCRSLIFCLGVLTVIVGKSGSGKSSIIGALLKEMQIKVGTLEWNK
jgi:ABC-type transport system involved in cytochrome bd biosynthesis fused ATPase/permease subunit